MAEDFDPIQQHRRDLRRQIILPFMLPVIALVGALVVLFVLVLRGNFSSGQVTVVAAQLMILCILLPTVILFFVLDALLLLLAFGAGTLPRYLRKPFALAQHYSAKGAAQTQVLAAKITAPIINLQSQIAFWRKLVIGSKPDEPK